MEKSLIVQITVPAPATAVDWVLENCLAVIWYNSIELDGSLRIAISFFGGVVVCLARRRDASSPYAELAEIISLSISTKNTTRFQ